MLVKNNSSGKYLNALGSSLLPLVMFWLVLSCKIPYSFSQYFHTYSFGLFLVVLILYCLAFQLSGRYRWLVCFALTMLLFSLTLSFKWTSGYSDNKVIAGFLPYKDGGGYYLGANLILNGMPLENTLQAGWRPLFSGFLTSVLFLVGGNLKLVLAILVLLAGIGAILASRQVFFTLGALPASLFITFLYFHIQPLLGLTMTELLGFTLGCLAFSMLWMSTFHSRWADIILGLLTLVLAMSVRAGTFFILPFLALWLGRLFRGERKFSWQAFGIALFIILVGYFAANSLYGRLVGIPEGTVFGNFAYSLYGQVQGGAGWHRAIEDLGTRDPALIYRAAFRFFLDHPFSLFIGTAKSYRDFFMPGEGSIFVFDFQRPAVWISYVFWGFSVFLLLKGLIHLIKNISSNVSAIGLAGFAGILLSIPFLPPIDGGSRFYAATMPFFFVVPVIGLARLLKDSTQELEAMMYGRDRSILHIGSIALSLLTIVTPIMILKLGSTPPIEDLSCSDGETPFITQLSPGAYVNLVSNGDACGLAPDICLSDFEKNGAEKSVDDFYQEIYSRAQDSKTDIWIMPGVNFIDGKLKYFLLSEEKNNAEISYGHISGCAKVIRTENQTIYQVESILLNRQ